MDEEEDKTNINIAKVNRLRKLRKEEDESLISGSDYVSRSMKHGCVSRLGCGCGCGCGTRQFLKKVGAGAAGLGD